MKNAMLAILAVALAALAPSATAAEGGSVLALHKFPTGFAFTDDKPASSYAGAVRITKLK